RPVHDVRPARSLRSQGPTGADGTRGAGGNKGHGADRTGTQGNGTCATRDLDRGVARRNAHPGWRHSTGRQGPGSDVVGGTRNGDGPRGKRRRRAQEGRDGMTAAIIAAVITVVVLFVLSRAINVVREYQRIVLFSLGVCVG